MQPNLRRVLITRPIEMAAILAQKIKNLNINIDPVIFPAITIKTINHNPAIFSIPIPIPCYQIIIFISPIAVEKFIINHVIDQKTLPKHIQLFGIGKGTALKIQEKKLGQAIFPSEKYNSEALLALNELKKSQVQHKKILICQGKGGKTDLKNTLTARGAEVTSLILYERVLPQPEVLPDLNQIELIVCSSSESLVNLIQLLGETVKEKKFLVSSEKLKALGMHLGLKYPPMLVKDAGDEAVLGALKNLYFY